jgi:hypothetical protein
MVGQAITIGNRRTPDIGCVAPRQRREATAGRT